LLVGYLLIGFFATRLAHRGIQARHLFATGFALNAAALAAIWTEVAGTYVWFGLYGLGASVNVLSFTVLNEGFARELTGRVNTAMNLVMFAGSFALQWGIGVIVDAAHAWLGYGTADGLRLAFALALACELATLGWFAYGWRRHARGARG
jgi:hypothetical protein